MTLESILMVMKARSNSRTLQRAWNMPFSLTKPILSQADSSHGIYQAS